MSISHSYVHYYLTSVQDTMSPIVVGKYNLSYGLTIALVERRKKHGRHTAS